MILEQITSILKLIADKKTLEDRRNQ